MNQGPLPATVAFIGGGNMGRALIGGLVRDGRAPQSLLVVEPHASARETLARDFGVAARAEPGADLAQAGLIVWAVKPQVFAAAAPACRALAGDALHLSVMAGVRSDSIAAATGSERVVRAMPNTPALIGRGIAGLYARPAVDGAGRAAVEALLAPTGQTLWLQAEDELDAVTALSGSGPAYVFYLLEAMEEAAAAMGLTAEQGRRLAQATVAGAAALAGGSAASPAELRAQVTSQGGTTHAAIESLQVDGVGAAIVRAILAAQARARELGRG